MLLKKLFLIWWDCVYYKNFENYTMKTINSTFFNNILKISTESVKKENVASLKKQKKEQLLCVILL